MTVPPPWSYFESPAAYSKKIGCVSTIIVGPNRSCTFGRPKAQLPQMRLLSANFVHIFGANVYHFGSQPKVGGGVEMTTLQAIVLGMAIALAPSMVAMAWIWWKESKDRPSNVVRDSRQPIYDLEDAPT